MQKIASIFILTILLVSCGSSKNVSGYRKANKVKRTSVEKNTAAAATLADKIVWTAVTYKGVPYRYGGMTKRGMDCSGLIFTSFKQRNVSIARTSQQMYVEGKNIALREVQRGDLLFFKTSRKRGKVNHVGLVTSVNNGDIRFIHSTTSQGVIVTSLYEKYWKRAFIKAKRVL